MTTKARQDFALVAGHLADPASSWSLGIFGAIAEFSRDRHEAVTLSRSDGTACAVTSRGGIRIDRHAQLRLFASESATRESWSQRVALCLPRSDCAMGGRTVLTELGPDAAALRPQDRDAVLLDLGLAGLQADCCVRVADPEVVAALRPHLGRALLAPDNPAMGIILAAHLHRVFMSRLGRIEVFGPIPPAGGTSPEGPHTHVLPRLLMHRLTHAASEPVPDGLVPCAHLYPPHPTKDAFGRARPFERGHHLAFQQILERYGDPEAIALKRRVAAAVTAGEDPDSVPVAHRRFARATIRVALRQMLGAHAPLPALARWMEVHEPRQDDSDPYAHG